jgi:hypothetical protein
LTKFTSESNPFIIALGDDLPLKIRERIFRLKEHSAARRKAIDEVTAASGETQAEPVVSALELSELLGNGRIPAT